MTQAAGEYRRLAQLSNEFGTVELDLDERDANGPRVRIHSVRDDREVWLDPHSLSLIAYVNSDVLGLLADIARDGRARDEFADWLQSRREKLVVPNDIHEGGN